MEKIKTFEEFEKELKEKNPNWTGDSMFLYKDYHEYEIAKLREPKIEFQKPKPFSFANDAIDSYNVSALKFADYSPATRAKCIEAASKLVTIDGKPQTLKQLLQTANELLRFINND